MLAFRCAWKLLLLFLSVILKKKKIYFKEQNYQKVIFWYLII